MAKRDAEHESGLRHPIHAAVHEAEHLREIAEKGESAATPAIIGGTVIVFAALILALILTLALGIAYLATRGGGGSSGAIKTAPAFSADEPSVLPTDNWITNGGSPANQRYSPLDQIDVSKSSVSAAAGKAVFAQNCATCHGNGGPDLTAILSAKNLKRVQAQVQNGGGGMPSFSGTLSQHQIADVAAFVVHTITNKK
jgi:mono/diheme cytochrome c family protein